MQLRDILHQLPQDALEGLARITLSQVADIRLPHTVLVDELSEVLDSSSYLSSQVALRHPPFFAILTLLMNAPGYSLPTEGFRQKVREETERMVTLASRSPIFPKPKNYNLYLRMLEGAWEEESGINTSEANLLRILRDELGISLMEHFIIEHHPNLHRYWRNDQSYEIERNHLRNAGILFALGDSYVLCEETVGLIRRSWGIELSELQFKRLLDAFSNEDLMAILENEGLTLSGIADEKKSRVLTNYVLPRTALLSVHLESLREVARKIGCRQSGTKEEVIENILDWLDSDEDIKKMAAREAEKKEEIKEITPEVRQITNEALTDLLNRLTQEALYDTISHLPQQRKSGVKSDRVKRLVDSPFSELTILRNLNNEILSNLCKQRFINSSGPKEEKIARLIQSYQIYIQQPVNNFKPSIESEQPNNQLTNTPPDLLLPHLTSVRSEYSFLNEYQQIVLSYLLDFKSITDIELEKLILRFSIPWVLLKAQMEELIGLLKTNGKDIIRVRGVGDYNIYEILN